MPCSIPPSNLAAFIARYLAQLEAIVIAKVYEEVNKIIEKLLNQACPPVEELKVGPASSEIEVPFPR